LIGVEVAAALATRGLEVTVVEREAWLFGRMAPEPVGSALRKILEAGGVQVLTSAPVTRFEREGKGYRVGTRSLDGSVGPTLAGDLVFVGVGVVPETGFVRGATLAADGGIMVDAGLRAAPGLWAAGDVAAWPDPRADLHHRVEHWIHAQRQGRVAGSNMAGGGETFAELTSYDTELFGTLVRMFGSPGLAESWRVEGLTPEGVALGSLDGRYIAAYSIGKTKFAAAGIQQILAQG
jgi:NADPH-dependent 2,4-dienoyl-CoA reductase/sulfur reductase-like enzyme